MEYDNTLILDIWENIKGYCPARKRDEMAHRLLHVFEDHGSDSKQFEQLLSEDFNLDNAIKEWISEDEDEYNEEFFLEDEEI